jgi:hypothetical protein
MFFKKIDFDTEKPFFTNEEGFSWYFDKELQDYIRTKNAYNLLALDNLNACVVMNKERGIEDYVLLEDGQPAHHYNYDFEGFGEMEAIINMYKISKHYDDAERE